MVTKTDWCSEDGATLLAKRITDYWQARGYSGITTSIIQVPVSWRDRRVKVPGKNTTECAGPAFGVISNIGPDGFPPPA